MLAAALILILLAEPGPNAVAIADIQHQIESRQYRAGLLQIAKVLKADNVTTAERYDLLMLRGEALLQLRQKPAAIAAFDEAAVVSRNDEDFSRPALARATVTLLRQSQGMSYRSKEPGRDIPLLKPEDRRRAMTALLADLLPGARKQVEQATRGRTLVPIEKLIPEIGDAYCLELIGTGKTEQTLPLVQQLGRHARGLIEGELARLNLRISQLTEASTDLAWVDGDILYKRGLTSPEQNELREMIPYLRRIQLVARDGRRINLRVGGDGENWDRLIADCDESIARAESLLASVSPQR